MLASVNLTHTAKTELSQQVSYLHLHGSARIAERFVDAVQKSFEQLALARRAPYGFVVEWGD